MRRTPPELVARQLKRWSQRWPREHIPTVVVLEGDADAFTEAVRASMVDAGLRVTLERCEHRGAEAVDHLGAGSFDYGLVGPSLHRLHELDRLTTLRAAERLARHGLMWTGLIGKEDAHTRRSVLEVRSRLSMRYLEGVPLPRFRGAFLMAGEFPSAWSGLGRA